MDNIFTLRDNDSGGGTVDIDELYERKQAMDEKKLNTYNKILGRLHNRIRLTSRQRMDEQFCWYVVPEILVGVAHYDHTECVKHVMSKMRENGFDVAYTHPNLLLVSWANWVPGYVRQEIKRQTGVKVDSKGSVVSSSKSITADSSREVEDQLLNIKTISTDQSNQPPETVYRDISSRTPSKKSIYSMDMFSKK
jgi:hypothetical protein